MVRRTSSHPTARRYVSIAEAAEHLGVSTDTIRRLIRSGDLAAFRVRNAIRLRIEDVDAVMRPVR